MVSPSAPLCNHCCNKGKPTQKLCYFFLNAMKRTFAHFCLSDFKRESTALKRCLESEQPIASCEHECYNTLASDAQGGHSFQISSNRKPVHQWCPSCLFACEWICGNIKQVQSDPVLDEKCLWSSIWIQVLCDFLAVCAGQTKVLNIVTISDPILFCTESGNVYWPHPQCTLEPRMEQTWGYADQGTWMSTLTQIYTD